jgi:hypothetical protein
MKYLTKPAEHFDTNTGIAFNQTRPVSVIGFFNGCWWVVPNPLHDDYKRTLATFDEYLDNGHYLYKRTIQLSQDVFDDKSQWH